MKTRAELEVAVDELGRALKYTLADECGFMLILSSWGENGWSAYVSNQERAASIEMLEELLVKLKNDNAQHIPFN